MIPKKSHTTNLANTSLCFEPEEEKTTAANDNSMTLKQKNNM